MVSVSGESTLRESQAKAEMCREEKIQNYFLFQVSMAKRNYFLFLLKISQPCPRLKVQFE